MKRSFPRFQRLGVRGYRRFSQYNYNYQYSPPPTRISWSKRLLFTGIGLTTFVSYVYYFWWPKHTFPSSVAKILRKGLWAESERGENDYQLALKHYVEALEHCEEIGLDSLSDEYTGIQLKIGEMFERLNMMEDAAYVYNEVATLYLKVLTAAPSSVDGKRIKSRDHRAHLIQKDLRLAIKLVELNRGNPQLSKAILMTHLLIAQDEIRKKLGPAGKFTQLVADNVSSEYKATISDGSIQIDDENGVVKEIQKNPAAWDPFKDEFFNAMDLLSATCMFTGDLAMATKVKISMTEWMLLADVEPHKVLLSQCNLASLLYLQAEEFESQEIALRRKFLTEANFDYDSLKNKLEQEIDAEPIVAKLTQTVSDADQNSYKLAIENKDRCIRLSIKSYESVLEFARTLPHDVVNNNNTILETVALATYGLGVVNLHLSEYEKAERLLREARVRSKGCGYDDLISEIERELSKLFAEKKLKSSGKVGGKEKGETAIGVHIDKT